MFLKPNKYTLIIFSLFLLIFALPPLSILLNFRPPLTGLLIIISAFSWFAPLAVLSGLGLNVFMPCLEDCLTREPNPFGLAITVVLNLIFFYFISSLIGTAINNKINN
jgi:hypothetical protein